MKGRDAAIRRILIRLKDYFAKRGWEDGKTSSATTLVMKATPNPGVAHRLVVDEPLAASLLPSTNVLGLGCSVSVYFEQLENIFNSIFGYNPDTYGRVSASVALCQVMPKGACHLGVHLVKPESETPISGLTADYESYLEPLIAQLKHLSVFERKDYVPLSVGPFSWNMRRAVYYYLSKSKDEALQYFDALEQDAQTVLGSLGSAPSGGEQIPLGSVANAVEVGRRRSAHEAKRLASTLRAWCVENRPKPT